MDNLELEHITSNTIYNILKERKKLHSLKVQALKKFINDGILRTFIDHNTWEICVSRSVNSSERIFTITSQHDVFRDILSSFANDELTIAKIEAESISRGFVTKVFGENAINIRVLDEDSVEENIVTVDTELVQDIISNDIDLLQTASNLNEISQYISNDIEILKEVSDDTPTRKRLLREFDNTDY